MTWVFAQPTILGSGLCVADIQVTVGQQTADCLRKIYSLAPNLIVGFAGNVAAGFQMLGTIEGALGRRPNGTVDIDRVLESIPEAAERAYLAMPDDHRLGGCALLVVGADRANDALYGSRPVVARFAHPHFRCEPVALGQWVSIGSGAHVEDYRRELEALTSDEARQLMVLESSAPGLYPKVMSYFVVQAVRGMASVPGISQHFHTGVVFAHGSEIGTSDTTHYDDAGQHAVQMPAVAETWDGLMALLQDNHNLSSGTAVA